MLSNISKEYIPITLENSSAKLSSIIEKHINEKYKKRDEIVVFCIGTDRATGDSLGPLVGSKLIEKGMKNVIGTIDTPVHAVNMKDKVKQLYTMYKNPFIVAVDASLGVYSNIGSLSVWQGALNPGSGLSKCLGEIGDISITGIVNKWSIDGIVQLQSTRLSIVMNMADVIAEGIYNAIGHKLN